MKRLLALGLIASVAFNAALAWFVFLAPSSPAPAAPPPAPAARPATPAPDAGAWQRFAGGATDVPALITTLRAQNFPPAVIRAIIAARIDETYAVRRRALVGQATNTPFWLDAQADPAVEVALRQLSREESKELRALLGNDDDDPTNSSAQNRVLDYLPAEKVAEIRRLQTEFDQRRSDLYMASATGSISQAARTALDKSQHDAIAAVLTPAELLEYDLRTSRTATNLRENLSAFQPTEPEFRLIYALQADFDTRFNTQDFSVTLTPDQRRDRDAAQKALVAQVKTALGAERGADYERSIDYNYRQTAKLVDRLELPPATTNQLAAVQAEFAQRRNELYRSTQDRTQATAALTALQQEAITRLTPILGSTSRVEAYKQYGGSWLNNLVPRPAPAAGAIPRN